MTECWLDSGLVTRIGRPSAISSPGTTMSRIGPKRSTMAGDTSADVTASDSPTPASRSRTRSRRRSGEGR